MAKNGLEDALNRWAADLPNPRQGVTDDDRAAVRKLFARPDQTGLAEGLARVAAEPSTNREDGKQAAHASHEVTLTEEERAEIRDWFRGVGQVGPDGSSLTLPNY